MLLRAVTFPLAVAVAVTGVPRRGGSRCNFRPEFDCGARRNRLVMNLPSFSGSLGVRFIFRRNNTLLVISSELSPFSFLVKFSPGEAPRSRGPP